MVEKAGDGKWADAAGGGGDGGKVSALTNIGSEITF